MPFKGKTFYQESRILDLNSRLIPHENSISSNFNEFSQQVSIFNDINESTISLIEYNNSLLNQDVNSLINIDSVMKFNIQNQIDTNYSKFLELTSTDNLENIKINSQISKFTSKSIELTLIDSLHNTIINQHILDFDNIVYDLIAEDLRLDSVLDSQIFKHTSTVTSIETTEASILNQNIINVSDLDSKISSLVAYDIILKDINSSFDVSIDSIIINYNNQVSIFEAKDTSLLNDINSHIVLEDITFSNLVSVDSIFENNFDSHLAIFSTDIQSLVNVDSNLLSQETSVYNKYDIKVADLINVDSDNNAQLSSQIVVKDEKFTILTSVDSTFQSDFQVQKSTFTDTFATLQEVDNILSSTLQSHIDFFGYTVGNLQNIDSQLQSGLTSYIDVFNPGVSLLDSTYSSNLNKFETILFNYDAKMILLDAKDAEQDDRLNDLEARVDAIDNDLSSNIDSALATLEFTSVVQEFAEFMYDEDSMLRSGIVLQVVTAVQNNVDSVQNSYIAQKLNITEYDSKVELLDSINFMNENKILALEEFLRITSNTYQIKNQQQVPYIYNGTLQQIPQVPFFNVIAKTTVNDNMAVVVQFNAYSFNTLSYKFVAQRSSGTVSYGKNQLNSDLQLIIPLGVSDAYISLKYLNINSNVNTQEAFITKNLLLNDIEALPVYEPPSFTYPVPVTGYNVNQGQSLSLTPTYSVGSGSVVSWKVTPSLPVGLSINSSGVISGTPTSVGSYTYSVKGVNQFGSCTFVVIINVVNNGPVPQWGRWIDGGSGDGAYTVATDDAGNVYITGQAAGDIQSNLTTYFGGSKPKPGNTNVGAFLMKYDYNGVPKWGRWLDGDGGDIGRGVATDKEGNIYITGQASGDIQSNLTTYFGGSKPQNGNNNGAFLMKYDSTGVPKWGRWIDGNSGDVGYTVATDSNNNVYIVGYTGADIQPELTTYFGGSKPGINAGAFLMKYDSTGVPKWGRWIDGDSNDIGYGVTIDSLDNVYITGYSSMNIQSDLSTYFGGSKPQNGSNAGAFLMKYDSEGVPQWGRWFDGSSIDVGHGVTTDLAGNVYITGYSLSNFLSELTTYFEEAKPGSNNGAFLMKYNSTGVPQWGRWIDGSGGDVGRGVATDTSGNVYIIGHTDADVQYNLTTYFGGSKIISGTNSGAFLMKYDSTGVPKWGRWIDGDGGDVGYGISIDKSDNIYITGYTDADVQSNLTTYFGGSKPQTLNGAFLLKFSQ